MSEAQIINLDAHRKPDAEEPEPAHVALARRIWNSTYPLSEREQMFIRNMVKWRDEPTPRQAAWLQYLHDQAEGFEMIMRGK